MALTTLGSKAEGSIVKIRENGVLVDFYIVKQNYESGLNGAGRVLMVRKDCYDQRQWSSSNINAFGSSTICAWLNDTYKNLLDSSIRTAMGTTKFYQNLGNYNSDGTRTLDRSVFLLSGTELGQTHDFLATEGTALPSKVINLLRIAYKEDNSTGCAQWTRSPYTDDTNRAWYLSAAGVLYYNSSMGKCFSRPAFTLPSSLYVMDSGEVTTNTAPSIPGSITVPTAINGGTAITVSWTTSTDAEDNLEGYIVQRSTDGGTSWSQIYQGSSLSTSNTVAFGTASVMYRVKAYDSEGLESGWKTSEQRTVLNNRAPSAPGSITVPTAVKGGGVLTVSWAAATDSDGNLSGYELERSVGGGAWTRVYRGTNRSYTDSITKGWSTVAYRVRAYDSNSAYSGYTTSPARTVNNNTAPAIASSIASSTDLGTKTEGFALTYTVTDADGDAVTVQEFLDGALQRTYTATLGQSNTFQAVTAANWQKVLNGAHTLKVTASDGKETGTYTLAFTKAVHAASVTLADPMEADAQITACALAVTGFIPPDADFQVEVTNNALDGTPVWEDCTPAVKAGANHVFANKTAVNGFAFNFRVSVERGASGQGGYITSIQGGFQ